MLEFPFTVVPRIEHVMPQGTYLGTLWHNTPCYPTLSVLCRGYLCHTTSRCRPVTLESVTMHKETCYVKGEPVMSQVIVGASK